MILCVNPNAAIDKTVIVRPFRLDAIHRPELVMALPGGKGCNVARALRTLGENPVVTGWVGGFAGGYIEAGLHAEGIETAFIHTEAESRTCLSILDPDGGTLTEIYERGEPVPASDVEALLGLFREAIRGAQAVTLSGSLPAGVPLDFYARLIELARAASVPALLDSSGEALRLGLAAGPHLIKPNRAEFVELAGHEPGDLAGYARAAAALSAERDVIVVLSLGAEGAIVAQPGTVLHARPPQVDATSAVGSGDCLLAGFAYGLVRGLPLAECLRYGVAAGTANALQLGAGRFSRDDFERLHAAVTVTPC